MKVVITLNNTILGLDQREALNEVLYELGYESFTIEEQEV